MVGDNDYWHVLAVFLVSCGCILFIMDVLLWYLSRHKGKVEKTLLAVYMARLNNHEK
jgi:hypothetical protein